jgi:hypothetical protein
VARLPEDTLSTAEIKALLQACSQRAPTGIRKAARIDVLWRCGLPCTEALALRPHDLDIDLDDGTLTMNQGKGGKRKIGVGNRPSYQENDDRAITGRCATSFSLLGITTSSRRNRRNTPRLAFTDAPKAADASALPDWGTETGDRLLANERSDSIEICAASLTSL